MRPLLLGFAVGTCVIGVGYHAGAQNWAAAFYALVATIALVNVPIRGK